MSRAAIAGTVALLVGCAIGGVLGARAVTTKHVDRGPFVLAARDRPSSAAPVGTIPLTLPAEAGVDGITVIASKLDRPRQLPQSDFARQAAGFIASGSPLFVEEMGPLGAGVDAAIDKIGNKALVCGTPWHTRIGDEPAAGVDCTYGANLHDREWRIAHNGHLYGAAVVSGKSGSETVDIALAALQTWQWLPDK